MTDPLDAPMRLRPRDNGRVSETSSSATVESPASSVNAAPQCLGSRPTSSKRKLQNLITIHETPKKKREVISVDENENGLQDVYCWACHQACIKDCLDCETCPRTFHSHCLSPKGNAVILRGGKWICPVCMEVAAAECSTNLSATTSRLSKEDLSKLLTFALHRMIRPEQSMSKNSPSDFYDVIFHPVDLNVLYNKVQKRKYGSTVAFYQDASWILHNSIVFSGLNSKSTNDAKLIIKICKHEMSEIELCPDCYLNSSLREDKWFCKPCTFPHCLVWAKLKGFPFWPSKVLRVSTNGSVDVRFFGAHDRAWVPMSQTYLLSEKPPVAIKYYKRFGFDRAIVELHSHVEQLRKRYPCFRYAPRHVYFKPENLYSCPEMFDDVILSHPMKQNQSNDDAEFTGDLELSERSSDCSSRKSYQRKVVRKLPPEKKPSTSASRAALKKRKLAAKVRAAPKPPPRPIPNGGRKRGRPHVRNIVPPSAKFESVEPIKQEPPEPVVQEQFRLAAQLELSRVEEIYPSAVKDTATMDDIIPCEMKSSPSIDGSVQGSPDPHFCDRTAEPIRLDSDVLPSNDEDMSQAFEPLHVDDGSALCVSPSTENAHFFSAGADFVALSFRSDRRKPVAKGSRLDSLLEKVQSGSLKSISPVASQQHDPQDQNNESDESWVDSKVVQDVIGKYSSQIGNEMRLILTNMIRELYDLWIQNENRSQKSDNTAETLKRRIEQMNILYTQTLQSLKENARVALAEVKHGCELSTRKILENIRQACEKEKEAAIAEAKKKQWCANCGKEAFLFCCWKTSYCGYNCQKLHWPQHAPKCHQLNPAPSTSSAMVTTVPVSYLPVPPSVRIVGANNTPTTTASHLRPLAPSTSRPKQEPQQQQQQTQQHKPLPPSKSSSSSSRRSAPSNRSPVVPIRPNPTMANVTSVTRILPFLRSQQQ